MNTLAVELVKWSAPNAKIGQSLSLGEDVAGDFYGHDKYIDNYRRLRLTMSESSVRESRL